MKRGVGGYDDDINLNVQHASVLGPARKIQCCIDQFYIVHWRQRTKSVNQINLSSHCIYLYLNDQLFVMANCNIAKKSSCLKSCRGAVQCSISNSSNSTTDSLNVNIWHLNYFAPAPHYKLHCACLLCTYVLRQMSAV